MPWRLPDSDTARLELAKGYPYAVPDGSYLFQNGEVRPLEAGTRDSARFARRTPVIAHGSNRSPDQLFRKFGRDGEIPVSRAVLADHDVVYSAHMTRYGAIAANLAHLPGVEVELWITWLDESQLARMHETELGGEIYRFGTLDGISLALESGPAAQIGSAGVYLSTYGYLAKDGAPIGLAAVKAKGRAHASLGQNEVLALVRERHRPGHELDDLLLAAMANPDLRFALIEEMRQAALPPVAPHFREILGP